MKTLSFMFSFSPLREFLLVSGTKGVYLVEKGKEDRVCSGIDYVCTCFKSLNIHQIHTSSITTASSLPMHHL